MFVLFALILLKTPVVGKYLGVLNTLIHEVGHAVISIVTGGKVEKISLFVNTEGAAWSSNRFWIGRILTSLAGYPASSLTALLFIYLLKEEKYLYILFVILFISTFSIIFWIRNLYGFLWTFSFVSLLVWIITSSYVEYLGVIFFLITAIVLVDSILASFDILKLSFKQPMNAGDATGACRSLIFVPPQVWGVMFFLQSVIVGLIGVKMYIS